MIDPYESRYIIIGRSSCPYCTHAVDYCDARVFSYVFLDYDEEREILEEYKEFHQQRTVPIVLANNLKTGLTKKIGGYSDLLDYSYTEQEKKKSGKKQKS